MQEGYYGIGRWYCDCLSERPNWRRYPAEKWFVTKKGAQMWAPLGKVYMVRANCTGLLAIRFVDMAARRITLTKKSTPIALLWFPVQNGSRTKRSWHIA